MHALIICDGEQPDVTLLQDAAAEADLVIATDGAATWAMAAGVKPQVVVGDLDSLACQEGDWEIVCAGPHSIQANSDAEKAILLALERQATSMVMLGATGQRLDHTLANVWLAAHYQHQANIVLRDDYGECRIISDRLELPVRPGAVISLMALTADVVVCTAGLRWPLDGPLAPGSRGLSNEAVSEPVVIEVASGLLAVITVNMSA